MISRMIIREIGKGHFEVTDDGHWKASFSSRGEAQAWIASQTTYQQQEREILPDDIRREAKRVEGAYMQRSAKEDLTYIVGLAILAERKRCAGLARLYQSALIEKPGGLRARPTFDDLAARIMEGDSKP